MSLRRKLQQLHISTGESISGSLSRRSQAKPAFALAGFCVAKVGCLLFVGKYGMVLPRKGRRFRGFDAKPSTAERIRLWRHYLVTPEPLGTRRCCLTAKMNGLSTASRASWRQCSLLVSRLLRCTSVNVWDGFPPSSPRTIPTKGNGQPASRLRMPVSTFLL